MTKKAKTKHHGKKHFYQYCLKCFSSSEVLECHTKNCQAINNTKSILLSEEDAYINFQKLIFERLKKGPFIFHGDFGSVLIPSTNKIDFGPDTKKYQDHIAMAIN